MRAPLFILISTVLFLLSCKKEKKDSSGTCDCPEDRECYELLKQAYSTGPFGKMDTPYYSSPCFNPNNANEIVYLGTWGALTKLDRKTKAKTILYPDGRGINAPKWSIKGWILFSRGIWLWKIKPDGSSLTLLDGDTTAKSSAEWSPDGTKLCYTKSMDTIIDGRETSYSLVIIADENGRALDTLENAGGEQISWMQENYILFSNWNGMYIYNIQTGEKEAISGCYSNHSGLAACWINEHNIFASTGNGLYTYNIDTKETRCIKKVCESRGYEYPNYSKQLNRIVTVKWTATQRNGYFTEVTQHLCLLSPDGVTEELIETK